MVGGNGRPVIIIIIISSSSSNGSGNSGSIQLITRGKSVLNLQIITNIAQPAMYYNTYNLHFILLNLTQFHQKSKIAISIDR